MKPLPPSIDVMEGFNVQMDCIIESSVELVQYKSSNIRAMQREFTSLGFEGRYKQMSPIDLPSPRRGKKETSLKAPEFVTKPQDVEVNLGETAMFECEVTGIPDPDVMW